MHIYYEKGPPSVTMGVAGTFEKGVSRDIDAELAKQILEKKSIVFQEGERTEPAAGEQGKEVEVPTPGDQVKTTEASKRVKEGAANGSN